MENYAQLTAQVVRQTEPRVRFGKNVPAQEKVVSIFEPHTDIIRKDNRNTFYGHKACLTGEVSNLILDCLILEGNPADTTLVEPVLDRMKAIYDPYPLKASFDGGFASTHPILENTTEKSLFLFGVLAMIPVNRRFMDGH